MLWVGLRWRVKPGQVQICGREWIKIDYEQLVVGLYAKGEAVTQFNKDVYLHYALSCIINPIFSCLLNLFIPFQFMRTQKTIRIIKASLITKSIV